MIKTKVTIMLLLSLAFSLTVNASVMAQYQVGVKNGDWIKYTFTISSSGQSMQGWIKLTIQGVSGTELNVLYEVGMAGQQLLQQQVTLDIETGTGTIGGFIVPANLTSGQTIPGQGTTVQSVVSRHGRTAIYATATDPYTSASAQMYWDQATGVLLESTTSISGVSYSMTPAETNMWSGGFGLGSFLGLEWWIWLIIIVVIVVVVVIAVVLMLRRRRPTLVPAPEVSPEQPPPPPPPSS